MAAGIGVCAGKRAYQLGSQVFSVALATPLALVWSATASNPRDSERLLREKLYKIKGMRHNRSSFVLRTLKKADLPLLTG